MNCRSKRDGRIAVIMKALQDVRMLGLELHRNGFAGLPAMAVGFGPVMSKSAGHSGPPCPGRPNYSLALSVLGHDTAASFDAGVYW